MSFVLLIMGSIGLIEVAILIHHRFQLGHVSGILRMQVVHIFRMSGQSAVFATGSCTLTDAPPPNILVQTAVLIGLPMRSEILHYLVDFGCFLLQNDRLTVERSDLDVARSLFAVRRSALDFRRCLLACL